MPDSDGIRVHAGSTNTRRTVLFVLAGVIAGAVVGVVVVSVFGSGRVFTGLLVGFVIGVAVIVAMRASFQLVMDDAGIVARHALSRRTVDWRQVRSIDVAVALTGKGAEVWTFTLVSAVDGTRYSDLLLEIPPVARPFADAYEFDKRQQVHDIFTLAKRKNVPVNVPSSIATALHEYWKLDPPTD